MTIEVAPLKLLGGAETGEDTRSGVASTGCGARFCSVGRVLEGGREDHRPISRITTPKENRFTPTIEAEVECHRSEMLPKNPT